MDLFDVFLLLTGAFMGVLFFLIGVACYINSREVSHV